jgi:hypothetical protein
MADTVITFNHAAQRQDPTVFDYAREVEQVWRDFPETKEKVFFLDICKNELVYPGEEKRRKKILEWINNRSDIQSTIKEFHEVKKSSCYMPYGGNDFGFVLLYTKKHMHSLFTNTEFVAQEVLRVFDHELGHAIVPNGTGTKNLGECIADAYSVIRHFQRYGADSAVIDDLVQNRAFQFIFREDRWTHFTSPVTEQILARRYDIDWDNLTPQETTKLARRFALEYKMNSVALQMLDHNFGELHGKIEDIKRGNIASLQALAKKALSTDSSYIFKYGAMALKFALDCRLKETYGITLTGEYWDNVRQQLAEKQKIFAAQDNLLFGLGATDRPIQSNVANNILKFKP